MDATARLLAIIAVAAFTTERIVAAVSYLINAVRLSRVRTGVAVRLRARERRKLVLFAVAAIIAFVVVARANLRLLHVLQINDVHPVVDFWMSWLVVVAGADRVHSMLRGGPSPSSDSGKSVIRVEVDGREAHRVS